MSEEYKDYFARVFLLTFALIFSAVTIWATGLFLPVILLVLGTIYLLAWSLTRVFH